MVNGLVDFRAGAIYFAFKQGDACVQLCNGKGVQILFQQQGERVVDLSGKIVVHIHARDC